MAAPPLATQLDQLGACVAGMCSTASTALAHATTALVDGRERLAAKVAEGDPEITRLREETERIASETLAIHSPVAGDLRTVVAALRATSDADRMARLAQHVAEVAVRRTPCVPSEVAPAFREMGRCAVGLGRKAAEVARTRNVVLAVELDSEDDAMDELHRRMFAVMMHPSWPHGVTAAVDATLLARYYERFADHAVKIAHLTVWAVTGSEPEALSL
ncbi:MAG: phosphate signaling complex protein PhoU [Pseudonocardia sp.]